MQPDWLEWHRQYVGSHTALSERLHLVQRFIRAVLEGTGKPRIQVVSICSGQAHDLIGALIDHPRREEVRGRLIEIDERSVRIARRAARRCGLSRLEFVCGDASVTDAYAGAVPADLVLCCGVFGNLLLNDVERTIVHLPQLCAENAFVIWTRHTRAPDVIPDIRRLFAAHGFAEAAFESTDRFGVGVVRMIARPQPLQLGCRIFHFGKGLWDTV